MSVAYVGIATCAKAFKEEQTWDTDERLQIISTTMLFKTIISLKN